MNKILPFLTLFLLILPIEGYSCECINIASSFTKRIKQADDTVLGKIVNELSDGYLVIEIIKDYSNKMNTKSILLFNGGGIDCLRNFSEDIGKQLVFALNRHTNSTDEQPIFEVPICIESALYLNKYLTYVKGNITRFNSFYSRVLYSLRVYSLPTNSWRIERVENRIKRKIR